MSVNNNSLSIKIYKLIDNYIYTNIFYLLSFDNDNAAT